MNVAFRDHRGMGAPFATALVDAGHDVSGGGVLLVDHEAPGPIYDRCFAGCEKAFLYPHGCGPLVYTLYPQRPETRGHFVIGSGQADVLAWNDDRPTEVVGWPYGPLLPWRASEGRRVLFAPTHADGFGWLPDEVLAEQARVLAALRALPVEIRVRHAGSETPMHIDIDWADVVVAAPGSFPSFAVSRGCPTVVYGEHLAPREKHPVTRDVVTIAGWDELLPSFRFPTINGGLAEQIDVACTEDVAAGWRAWFVGDEFDPGRFAEVFMKAVESW